MYKPPKPEIGTDRVVGPDEAEDAQLGLTELGTPKKTK